MYVTYLKSKTYIPKYFKVYISLHYFIDVVLSAAYMYVVYNT